MMNIKVCAMYFNLINIFNVKKMYQNSINIKYFVHECEKLMCE